MTTQEKFTATMEALAADHDLDLVVDHSYANTGRMAFQRRTAFAPVLTFTFNFQGGYAVFNGPDIGPGWGYVDGERTTLDEFVAHVSHLLAQVTA